MSLRTYLLCRIIFTFIFLITSTYIWYHKRDNIYHPVENRFIISEIAISDLNKIDDGIKSYDIKIKNIKTNKESFKMYIIPNLLEKNLSNNYIKYQINNSDIKTLNMDGMIYGSSINGLETVDYDLKIWISDTYQGDLKFNGRIVIV